MSPDFGRIAKTPELWRAQLHLGQPAAEYRTPWKLGQDESWAKMSPSGPFLASVFAGSSRLLLLASSRKNFS